MRRAGQGRRSVGSEPAFIADVMYDAQLHRRPCFHFCGKLLCRHSWIFFAFSSAFHQPKNHFYGLLPHAKQDDEYKSFYKVKSPDEATEQRMNIDPGRYVKEPPDCEENKKIRKARPMDCLDCLHQNQDPRYTGVGWGEGG